MKKTFSIILITIVNLSFSQDPRIFENAWYLTNVIVNGVNNFPPNENMNISFISPENFTTYSCNTMYASVVFENNNTNFSASNYAYTLDICTNPTVQSYQNLYFAFFLDGNEPNPTTIYNFTYTITEDMNVRTLTINSMFNQQAVYSSANMSNNDFSSLDVSFSPNPSNDFLTINFENEIDENVVVEFYNEIGQLCKTVNLNNHNTSIDINNLSIGVYIIKIKSENGNLAKKFIKI